MLIIDRRSYYDPGGCISALGRAQQAMVPGLRVTTLEAGDFLIVSAHGSIGIEHKTARGLVSDLESGRLVEQLSRMLESYDGAVLLIQGSAVPSRDSLLVDGIVYNIGRLTVDNFIFCWGLRGVHTEWVSPPTVERVAERVADIHEHMLKHEHASHLRQTRLFSWRRDRSVEPALWLPGVDAKIGERLRNAFPTPLAMFNADQDMLDQVEMVGPVRAEQIHKRIRQWSWSKDE